VTQASNGLGVSEIAPEVFPRDMQGIDLTGDLGTEDYSMIGNLMDNLDNADWVSGIFRGLSACGC